MKRTLSLVLALVMVLGSFGAVFAVDTEDAVEVGAFLEAVGVLEGDDEGNLMLEDELVRKNMVVLLSRLMGDEETAVDFPSESLTFEDILNPFYNGYIAWAVDNNLIEGRSPEVFGYNDVTTAQEYAAVLMRALGYDTKGEAYKTVFEDAKALGLFADTDVEATTGILRGQMAVMTFNALGTPMKDSEVTLAEDLAIEMPEPAEATEVEDVYADNLVEVKVVFDGEVDKDTAEDDGNYTINNSVTVEEAELSEDMTMVTLTVKGTKNDAMENQKEHKLKVSNIKAGDEILKKQEIKFTPVDVTVPVVEDVIALGTKAIKVVFSEPVKKGATSTSNYKIDGKSISGSIRFVSDDAVNNAVIIRTNVAVGEHELSVKNVEDYAEFKVQEPGFAFEVVEDNDAPEIVSAKSIDLKKVEVIFNETVKNVKKAYHTSTSNSGKNIK
ncbi:MAG TPA: hypothetical protein VFC79_01890, partial [Tissierellaceae bacterium]|nr:hypothetical protein [Tissierellaceae bacterium]